MNDNELNEIPVVQDLRTPPFVTMPPRGTRAIGNGKLEPKEISVYLVLNMIIDGAIQGNPDVPQKEVVAHCTGLTPRQVANVYNSLHKKGVVEIKGNEILL